MMCDAADRAWRELNGLINTIGDSYLVAAQEKENATMGGPRVRLHRSLVMIIASAQLALAELRTIERKEPSIRRDREGA